MKRDSLYKKLNAMKPEQQVWLLGNETEDSLGHGLDCKRVIHPGQGRVPIVPQEGLQV